METETIASTDRPPVFPGNRLQTNMPFFDGTTLVFGQSAGTVDVMIPSGGTIFKRIRHNRVLAERMKDLPRTQKMTYRPWKMAYCDWKDKTINKISTGFSANVTERSPTFYREGDQIVLSFIAGGPTNVGFHYRLFTCSGPDLAHLGKPKLASEEPVFFGFVNSHYICKGVRNTIQLSEKATGSSFKLQTGFHRVSNVNFLSDNPTTLVITGLIDKEYNCETVLYELDTGKTSNVTVGAPVYKASMSGNQLIFTERLNDVFESRELHYGDYSLSSSTIQISKEK